MQATAPRIPGAAQAVIDDLHLLTAALPPHYQKALEALAEPDLLEVVMDLGRPAQARFPGRAVDLSAQPVTREELATTVAAVGAFGADNRAGIEGTLHRIAAIRNRKGQIIGLTLRVGRAVFGTINQIRDLVERGESILLLGRPGVGKTTKLREVARVLADEVGKRVVVIDTSNEIAGDGDIPHPAIGSARRMQVAHPDQQHAVMIEAVENHMPEVIIIDEIGTAAEAMAARTIAERGVQLIGTAHGNRLENLVLNPTLSDLVGGVQTVTLGDEEARLRGTQKTINERKTTPTFHTVVEIVDRSTVVVHADAGEAVDRLLRGEAPDGVCRGPGPEPAPQVPAPQARPAVPEYRGPVRIYPYAISRDSVERVIRGTHLDARTVNLPQHADFVVALRSRSEDPRLQRILQASGAPLHVVRKNTTAQIRHVLQGLLSMMPDTEDSETNEALQEAEEAARRVAQEGVSVELAPRPGPLRKLQHRVAVRHRLSSESVGSEPQRRLVIHPR